MAGPYRYVIGPVIEAEALGMRHYAPPEGCVSWIDLRRVGQMAALGQTGYGFFTMPSGWSIPQGYHWLGGGEGDCRSLYLSALDKSAWESIIGARPTRTPSTTLIDALDETLTTLADPTGDSGPKPIVPGTPPPGPPLEADIILAGHSTVRTKQLPSAGRWWNNIQSLHRRDLDLYATERGNDDRAWRKLAGCLAQKYHGRWDDIRGNDFLPQRLKSDRAPSNPHAPKAGRIWAVRPETTLIETWPNNAADIEATSQDYSWETLNLINWKQTLQVSGGECYCDAAASGYYHHGRCTTAISSADHYAAAPLTVSGNYGAAVCARMNGAGVGTCYVFDFQFNASRRLFKWVAETYTLLTSTAMSGGLSAVMGTCRANGSAITGMLDGYGDIAGTDTAISGNVYGGVAAIYHTTVTDCKIGSVTIADLAAATVYSNLLLLGVG